MKTCLTTRGRCIVATLLATAAIACSIGTTELRAGCCELTIHNNTPCTFRACAQSAAWTECVAILPGTNVIPIPDCADITARWVVDACGIRVDCPTFVDQCIDILLPDGCCIRACKLDECTWTVQPGNCSPC